MSDPTPLTDADVWWARPSIQTLADLVQAGLDHHGETTKRFADRSGLNHSTVYDIRRKGSVPRDENLRLLADGLGVPMKRVTEVAAGMGRMPSEPWVPPKEVNSPFRTNRLNHALSELVRAEYEAFVQGYMTARRHEREATEDRVPATAKWLGVDPEALRESLGLNKPLPPAALVGLDDELGDEG